MRRHTRAKRVNVERDLGWYWWFDDDGGNECARRNESRGRGQRDCSGHEWRWTGGPRLWSQYWYALVATHCDQCAVSRLGDGVLRGSGTLRPSSSASVVFRREPCH